MRELGIKKQILSIGTIAQPNVIKQAGESLEGAIFTTTEFSSDTPKTETARRFIEKYLSKYNKLPNYFSAFSYDSILIIAEAIKKGSYTSKNIREELLKIKNFHGVSGMITIKSNGDADFPMVIKIIKNGRIEDVK